MESQNLDLSRDFCLFEHILPAHFWDSVPLFRYEKFWLPLIAELSDSELRDLDYAPPMGESVYPTIMILFIRDWRFELLLSRLGTRDMLHFQHTVPKITCPDGADETVQYTVLGTVYNTVRYSIVCLFCFAVIRSIPNRLGFTAKFQIIFGTLHLYSSLEG